MHKAGSVAIDAGSAESAPSIDIEGNARPCGQGYDIGAFEYVLYGDLNEDAVVNVMDFARFAEHWHQSGGGLVGDLDRDLDVDSTDLSVFVNEWLDACYTIDP